MDYRVKYRPSSPALTVYRGERPDSDAEQEMHKERSKTIRRIASDDSATFTYPGSRNDTSSDDDDDLPPTPRGSSLALKQQETRETYSWSTATESKRNSGGWENLPTANVPAVQQGEASSRRSSTTSRSDAIWLDAFYYEDTGLHRLICDRCGQPYAKKGVPFVKQATKPDLQRKLSSESAATAVPENSAKTSSKSSPPNRPGAKWQTLSSGSPERSQQGVTSPPASALTNGWSSNARMTNDSTADSIRINDSPWSSSAVAEGRVHMPSNQQRPADFTVTIGTRAPGVQAPLDTIKKPYDASTAIDAHLASDFRYGWDISPEASFVGSHFRSDSGHTVSERRAAREAVIRTQPVHRDDFVSEMPLSLRHGQSTTGWGDASATQAAQLRDLSIPLLKQNSSPPSASGWEDEPMIKHASERNPTHNGWAAVEKDQLRLSNLPTPGYPVASRDRSETSSGAPIDRQLSPIAMKRRKVSTEEMQIERRKYDSGSTAHTGCAVSAMSSAPQDRWSSWSAADSSAVPHPRSAEPAWGR